MIIIMIAVTQLNQNNRIINMPPSTNQEAPLNNIIKNKIMVRRKIQRIVAAEEEVATKDLEVTEAEEVEVAEVRVEVVSMTRNHRALKRLAATDLSN